MTNRIVVHGRDEVWFENLRVIDGGDDLVHVQVSNLLGRITVTVYEDETHNPVGMVSFPVKNSLDTVTPL